MRNLNNLCEILMNSRRSLHLAANSNILENSCWELRKQATARRSADQLIYRQLLMDNIGLTSLGVAEKTYKGTMRYQDTVRNSLPEKRFDLAYYKPKTLKERIYNRTWADFKGWNDLKSHRSISETAHSHRSRTRSFSYTLKKVGSLMLSEVDTVVRKPKVQKANSTKPDFVTHDHTNRCSPSAFSLLSSTF